MKRIIFILLLPLLPYCVVAQGTIPDTIRVLTDGQITQGSLVDTTNFYFIQSGWKKQSLDSLSKYMRVKNGQGLTIGDNNQIIVVTPTNWVIDSNTITTGKIVDANITYNKLAQAVKDSINVGVRSITTGTGLTGGTITTTGTIAADLNVLMELVDTVSLSNRINSKLDTVDNSVKTKHITDGSITGIKTNFSGISNDATRLLGAQNNGSTDTVQVGGGLSLANGILRSKQDTMAMIIACSDETTNITATGNPKVTFRTPFAITVTGVKASLTTASSSGNVTVDVKNGNTTILSGFLQIDANQTTSVTSGTQRTVTAPNIASDNEVKIDINAAGTGAKGLKVTILYIRP